MLNSREFERGDSSSGYHRESVREDLSQFSRIPQSLESKRRSSSGIYREKKNEIQLGRDSKRTGASQERATRLEEISEKEQIKRNLLHSLMLNEYFLTLMNITEHRFDEATRRIQNSLANGFIFCRREL